MGKWAIFAATTALAGIAAPTAFAASTQDARSLSGETKAQARKRLRDERRAEERRQAALAAAQRLEASATDNKEVAPADIIVIGIRGAIDSAITRKQKSSQIVDSIVAEDAGKLPDNNVAEAIGRIPGVNIERAQGQGGSVTIRGLAGVQTTLNGQDVSGGDARQLSLSDIPAELIKAIDVYKSRSASQPEGGIGGTVNVDLRRPLDLRKGWLVAGSVRGVYNDVVKKTTPYASLLVSNRFDTGIGEMGFLINGSYTRTKYAEPLIESESPDQLCWGTEADFAEPWQPAECKSIPAARRAIDVALYKIRYGLNSGDRTQRALNGAWQWRPSDKLNFVVEGQYFGAEYRDRYSGMSLQTREGGSSLSNIVRSPNNAIISATYTTANPVRDTNGKVVSGLPLFVNGGESKGRSTTVIGTVEAHWASGIARIDATAQYQRYVNNSYGTNFGQRVAGATVANVDFSSKDLPGNAPIFSVPGVSFTDPTQMVLSSFGDRINRNTTNTFIAQVDTSLSFGDESFLRDFKFGARFSRRDDKLTYGYRNLRWDNPAIRPNISKLNVPQIVVSPDIEGRNPISYVTYDPTYVFNNFDALKSQVLALGPDGFDGNGPQTSAADFIAAPLPSGDRLQGSTYLENNFAFYGEARWGTRLIVPVDGLVGLRVVNVYGRTNGAQLVIPSRPDGTCCGDSYIVDNNSRANGLDLLPSASAVWHLDDKFQLRTAYNHNVQRPSFYALRSTIIIINPANPDEPIYAGNPALRPTKDDNFNASFEWYPRAGTSLTLNAFYKKQTDFIYYTRFVEPVEQLGGARRTVFKERNAGPGETYGLEFAGTLPFFFAPGFTRNFGVSGNFTYIPHARLSAPNEDQTSFTDVPSPFTSKYTFNTVLFYDTPKLSGRLAYNWRSPFKTGFNTTSPEWITRGLRQQQLDAAINYTPVRFLTLSVEATNLLHDINRYRYDLYPELSGGFRALARTVQASARFRF